MKSLRWRTLAKVGLLALPLLGLVYWAWDRQRHPRPPSYEGKTLTEWIGDLSDPEYPVGDRAADALVHAGADAVPVLLEARAQGDIRLHRRAAAVLVRIGAPAAPGLVAALKDGPNDRVEIALVRLGPDAVPALIAALQVEKSGKEAARVLGLMGPRAAGATPALIAVLQQRRGFAGLREEAAAALGAIGAPVADIVPALIAALQDENAMVRQRAAESLGWIGPAAHEATPALVAALKDDKPEVAALVCLALARLGDAGVTRPLVEIFQSGRSLVADAAGRALWQMGPAAKNVLPALVPLLKGPANETARARTLLLGFGPIAVPQLLTALKDDEPAIRQAAAETLGLIGPVARDAVPALTGALEDKNPAIALAAAVALTQIDPTRARDAVPRLTDALDYVAAVEALADMGPEARAAMPALVGALKHRDKAVRYAAGHALACIGSAAVPSLIDTLKDQGEDRAIIAAEALGSILPASKEAIPALREALQSDRPRAAAYARALGRIGPPAREAVPDLTALLMDAAVRIDVAVALVRIDPSQTDKAVAALIEELKTSDLKRQLAAIHTLGQWGAAAKPAIPLLAARLKDRELTEAVLTALVHIGPAAIPVLADLLDDPNVEYRRLAVFMLAQFGPSAHAALTPLMRVLKDSDTQVASGAAHVLEEIGPDARAAVPSLIENLTVYQSQVRGAAAVALGHMGPSAKEARAPLLECLMDPDKGVRYAAALALGRIDPKNINAVPALRDALHDADPEVWLAAIDSLARIDRARLNETVPILVAMSQKPYYLATRFKAVEGLADLALEKAKTAVPLLDTELHNPDPDIRLAAALLLERIQPDRAFAIVLALTSSLKDRSPRVRGTIAHALGLLGTKAREAVPALLRLLHDEAPAVRAEAAKSLWLIDAPRAKRLGLGEK